LGTKPDHRVYYAKHGREVVVLSASHTSDLARSITCGTLLFARKTCGEDTMPTTNPRVNVVLEEPVYEGLRRWAKRDGVSLSLKVRDLVKDALEAEEDRALADLAKDREQTLDRSKAKTHSQTWAHLKQSRR
jgi:plasmid stability protein